MRAGDNIRGTVTFPADRYVTVEGHRVRYWEEGAGPPIVLVHGLANSVITWRKNVEALGRNFRVIALDLPGHGLSDMPKVRFDLPEGAAFVASFLDEMGVDRGHLVGNSMGGAVALELALARPDRTASLTLADSAGLGREISFVLRLGSLPLLGEYARRPTLKGVRNLVRWLVHDPNLVDEDELPLRLSYLKREGSAQALLGFLRTGVGLFGQRPATRRDAVLSSVSVPTLIVWGAQDPLFPIEQAQGAAHAIPGATLHVFDACGHWPQYEHPEAFNRLLGDFVESVG